MGGGEPEAAKRDEVRKMSWRKCYSCSSDLLGELYMKSCTWSDCKWQDFCTLQLALCSHTFFLTALVNWAHMTLL